MNTPNPLVPQGSFQEQSKRKSQVRLIVFSILAIHVLLLGALLIQGCKRDDTSPAGKPDGAPLPVVDTNTLVPPPPPPPMTNEVQPPPPSTNTGLPPVGGGVEPQPPGANLEHVIAKGETFAVLAKKYGVSVKAIQQANPGVDPAKLKIGQKIIIPPKPPGGATPGSAAPSGTAAARTTEAAANTYVVQKGDTLTKVATAKGVTIKALRAANNLRTDQIRPGQKLKIPAKNGGSTTAPIDSPPPPPVPAAPLIPPTSAPSGTAPAPTGTAPS
jgi:LysM repeat protein